jgi:hypothetical protein
LSAIHQQLKTLNTTYRKFKKQNKEIIGSSNQTQQKERKNMSQTVDEEIDLTDITRNNSPPTLISITKARREISRQLQTRVCADPHTHDHGHSYIVWSNNDLLKK